MNKQIKKLNEVSNLIGNTPLLEISLLYKNNPMKIYVKAEYYNLTGSIKDRVAFNILKTAYEENKIQPENVIVEATSGNMGISFCALGTLLNHKVIIHMPDWMSSERIKLMHSYNATVRLISKENGGFLGCIKTSEEFKSETGVFLPRQFANNDNVMAHYKTTAPEADTQLLSLGLKADAVVAGVGTGGTIMGMGNYFKEKYKSKVYPIEPSNSPTLSTGYKVGKHRIQGISDDFVPDIMDMDKIDEVISVDDGDSIIMAQKLSKILGLGVGISSGTNFLGAIKAYNKLGENSVVLTVFADDNKKYLSTDYSKIEPIKEGFLSSDVDLISVNSFLAKQ